MRVNQVLEQVNEGWLDLLMGAAVGNLTHQTKTNGSLGLMVTAATYAALTHLAPAQRRKVVITAKDQTEALANQKVVQHLIDKMSYNLDEFEHISKHGRRWTLSTNK